MVLGSGALTAPANGYVKVTVKANLNPVDGSTVVSGDTPSVYISGTNVVKATGMGSGAEVTTSTSQTAVGSTMTLVKAKPVVPLAPVKNVMKEVEEATEEPKQEELKEEVKPKETTSPSMNEAVENYLAAQNNNIVKR